MVDLDRVGLVVGTRGQEGRGFEQMLDARWPALHGTGR